MSDTSAAAVANPCPNCGHTMNGTTGNRSYGSYQTHDTAYCIRYLRDDLAAARAMIREQALQYLATEGQAQEAYAAQVKAEADRDAAVMAERERCAKIADKWMNSAQRDFGNGGAAAEIRKDQPHDHA